MARLPEEQYHGTPHSEQQATSANVTISEAVRARERKGELVLMEREGANPLA